MNCNPPLAGLDALAEMANEQASAKGSFPGPLPVVRSDVVTSIRCVHDHMRKLFHLTPRSERG